MTSPYCDAYILKPWYDDLPARLSSYLFNLYAIDYFGQIVKKREFEIPFEDAFREKVIITKE